ncbi:hypothetical protein M3Y97_00329400 [Aphelenchoides bicaudatus]|nr:hypothetical protein M3Y97_00329400 [Aphelenchoides bicaudatus]
MSDMTDLSDIESGSISINSALSDSMSSIELIDSYSESDSEPALLVLEEDDRSSMPINLEDQLAEAMQEGKEGEEEIKKAATKQRVEVENNNDYQLNVPLNERRHGDSSKTTPLVLEKSDVEKEDILPIPSIDLSELEHFLENIGARPPRNSLNTDDISNAKPNENKDFGKATVVDQSVAPAAQQKSKKKTQKHKKRKLKEVNLPVASSSSNNIPSTLSPTFCSSAKKLSDQEVDAVFKSFELASHNLHDYINTMQRQSSKLSQFNSELKSAENLIDMLEAKVGSALREIKQQEMNNVEEESNNVQLSSINLSDEQKYPLDSLKERMETPFNVEPVDPAYLLSNLIFEIELNRAVNKIISIIKMPSTSGAVQSS